MGISLRSRLFFCSLLATLTFASADVATAHWVSTWVSAQQLTEPHNMPPAPGLAGQTLRQIVQPSLSGTRLRVSISNQYGETPLVVASAGIARSAGNSTLEASSARALTFNGQSGVTVLPGARLTSDALEFSVAAFENVAVSLQLTTVPEKLTGHPGSRTTSYLVPGDAVAATTLEGAVGTDHWYVLAGIDVLAPAETSAVVVIGDSITDGRGSTTNANDRWPNVLARRLHARPDHAPVSVLNQGAGGGRVLRDGLGDSALRRFDRDVLAVPGVRTVVVFKGVNDIGGAIGARARGQATDVVGELILAYREMAMRARSHGLRVLGATILPFEGSQYHTPESEADRQKVNTWIRESGEFDGVIDFDAIARDPANPSRLRADVDGGDHLHPSAEGYRIMAEGIDLQLFK